VPKEVERVGAVLGVARLTVGIPNEPAQALYRGCGYVDSGLPPKRVQGTIVIRTGPLEVHDTPLTWEKRLGPN
jgi:hypothetical protein